MSHEQPTVGYVGLNHHHRDPYLETLAQLPVTVTSVCEPDESVDAVGVATNAGLVDAQIYRDPETLLAEADVDVVWITLSNQDTPAVIEAAAEYGVDVYTEKPVARTAAELESVRDTVATTDVTVGVSYTWRTHPIAKELHDRVVAGYFGDVRSFESRFVASKLAHRDTDHFLFEREASRGGITQWLGIHWIDLVPWMLDDPIARVNATMRWGTPDVDVEDDALLQFETESGALGSLHCGYHLKAERYDTAIGIYGTDARSKWDPMGEVFGFDGETTLEVERTDDAFESAPRQFLTYDYNPLPGYGGAFGLEFIRSFFDARTGSGTVPADLDDAIAVLQVLDAAYESAESGTWVDVDR